MFVSESTECPWPFPVSHVLRFDQMRVMLVVLGIALTGCAVDRGNEAERATQREEILREKREVARLEQEMERLYAELEKSEAGVPCDIQAQVAAYRALPRKAFISVGNAGEYEAYLNVLLDRISSSANKHYPDEARGKLYGHGVATFVVTRVGGLESAGIDRSSGYRVLDESFLSAIRASAPFPEIPGESVDLLSITLPFDYGNTDSIGE